MFLVVKSASMTLEFPEVHDFHSEMNSLLSEIDDLVSEIHHLQMTHFTCLLLCTKVIREGTLPLLMWNPPRKNTSEESCTD